MTPDDVTLTLAVKDALLKFPSTRVVEIVRTNPEITVNQFCKLHLAGIDLRCYGGTRRAYFMVWRRLQGARRQLES